jgi:hypothetical protein
MREQNRQHELDQDFRNIHLKSFKLNCLIGNAAAVQSSV